MLISNLRNEYKTTNKHAHSYKCLYNLENFALVFNRYFYTYS